jgi:hypothetical protein
MWRSHLAVQVTPRATLGKNNLDAMVPATGGPIRLIDPVFGDKLIPDFGSPNRSKVRIGVSSLFPLGPQHRKRQTLGVKID